MYKYQKINISLISFPNESKKLQEGLWLKSCQKASFVGLSKVIHFLSTIQN